MNANHDEGLELRPELKLRPELNAFAQHMEHVLRANDHKSSWRLMTLNALINRAIENLDKLLTETNWDHDPEKIAKHCADIANYMLMIADNAKYLPHRYPPPTNQEATP